MVCYRLYITDLILGLIYFCFFVGTIKNLDKFLFIMPCVFPAFFMYIVDPILGLVYCICSIGFL